MYLTLKIECLQCDVEANLVEGSKSQYKCPECGKVFDLDKSKKK